MAYMNQEKKAAIAPQVNAVLKKYNMMGSLRVRNKSTLCLTIKSGAMDAIGNYNETYAKNNQSRFWHPAVTEVSVNPYHYDKHFSGSVLEFMTEIFDAMNEGNHDRSDVQTDYFDVGWYVDVSVGRYNQAYLLT